MTDRFRNDTLTEGEIDFSKNLIDDIFNKKSKDPALSTSKRMNISNDDVRKMHQEGSDALSIAGLQEKKRKSKSEVLNEMIDMGPGGVSLTEETLRVVQENYDTMPKKIQENVMKIAKKMDQYENYLKKVLKKYS